MNRNILHIGTHLNDERKEGRMKDLAKILSLVLIFLLLLPAAKIDYKEEMKNDYFEISSELKEYMNTFTIGLGIDQTLKFKYNDESEKNKPEMSGSLVGILVILTVLGGAVFMNVFYDGEDKSTYILMGIYGALVILLLLLPGAVKNLTFDGETMADSVGAKYLKMTLFYFVSLLSAAGVLGIFAKEKFLKS